MCNFVKKAIGEGHRPEMVGGGLIRSLGGWSPVKTRRRPGEREFSDARILGNGKFGARMTEQKRNLSLDEVLRQRDETHHRLIEVIQTVPEDQIARETRFRRRLRLDTYSHYPEHAEAIWNWREQRSAG